MRTPGIGTRNKRFKNLAGRGKKPVQKRKYVRKRTKPKTERNKKLSRKLRNRRAE